MSQRGLIAAAALVALAAGFVLGRGCAPPTTTPVPAISRTSPDARAPDTRAAVTRAPGPDVRADLPSCRFSLGPRSSILPPWDWV